MSDIQQTSSFTESLAVEALGETLSALFVVDDIVEVRGLYDRRRAAARYLLKDSQSFDTLAAGIARVDSEPNAPNLYLVLNPTRRPAVRYGDVGQGACSSEAHIPRYRWTLSADCDVRAAHKEKRPATDEEYEAALQVAYLVRDYLEALGFRVVVASSGNGVHVLVFVDLPRNEFSKHLVATLNAHLATKFSTALIDVQGFDDANRLTRCYGTLNRKGSAPQLWRRSKLLYTSPRADRPEPRDLLDKIAEQHIAEGREPITTYAPGTGEAGPWITNDLGGRGSRLEAFRKGIRGFKYRPCSLGFAVPCPGHAEVGGWEDGALHSEGLVDKNGKKIKQPLLSNTTIVWVRNGLPVFDCKHHSCAKKTWKHFQQHYDPERLLHRHYEDCVEKPILEEQNRIWAEFAARRTKSCQ